MKKLNVLSVMLATTLVVLFAACSSGTKTENAEAEGGQEVVEVEAPKINLTAAAITLDESSVKWKGEMLGVYSHEGTISFTEGNISVADNAVTGGSFVVDMSSINPTDENYDEEKTQAKLVGHLSSDDFFSVEGNPTASFEITSVEGNSAKGNLTIRGKTNEETVENIEVIADGSKVVVSGNLTFDRKKYDVSWDHPIKDNVLSSDISLNIELIASN